MAIKTLPVNCLYFLWMEHTFSDHFQAFTLYVMVYNILPVTHSQCLTFSHLLFGLSRTPHASCRLFFHQRLHHGLFPLFSPPPPPLPPHLTQSPPHPPISPSLLQSFFPFLLLLSGTVLSYRSMNRPISKSQHFSIGL